MKSNIRNTDSKPKHLLNIIESDCIAVNIRHEEFSSKAADKHLPEKCAEISILTTIPVFEGGNGKQFCYKYL